MHLFLPVHALLSHQSSLTKFKFKEKSIKNFNMVAVEPLNPGRGPSENAPTYHDDDLASRKAACMKMLKRAQGT